jgi:predicted ester cyclase
MPTSTQTTTEVATDYFAAVGNRDLQGMTSRWQPGSRSRIIGVAEMTAPDDIARWFGGVFEAFPDFTMTVEKLVTEGETAAVHWSATGTFSGTGSFEGMKPNGARIAIEGLDILTIEDGQVTSLTAVLNGADLARQLGAMPPTGSTAEKVMLGAFNARTAARAKIGQILDR